MFTGLSSTRSKYGAFALACLVVVVPALARLPFRQREGGQAHLAIAEELAACLAAAACAFVAAGRAARDGGGRETDTIDKLVLVLAGFEIASALFAPNPWMALRAGGLMLAGIATFRAARVFGQPTLAPLVAVLFVAGSVVLEAFVPSIGWSRSGHAPGGLIGERNAASEFLVCALPFATAAALRHSRALVRRAATGLVALTTAAVVFSRTRSVWLATFALAALALVLAVRTKDEQIRGRAASVMFAAALGGALALVAPTKLAWSSARPYHDTLVHLVDRSTPSGGGRLVQYATTATMALRHPLLGVGPGNWAGQYVAYAADDDPTVRGGFYPTTRVPASDILGFVAERGVIAGLVALALALALARRATHGDRGGDDADRWLRRSTLLAVLVVASLDAVLVLGPHLLLVAWILGSASPARRAGDAASSRPWLHRALAVVSLGAALFAGARVASFALAVRVPTFASLERAASLDPGNVALRLGLASDLIEAGDCERAGPHLATARRYAVVPAAKDLDERCRPERAPEAAPPGANAKATRSKQR